MANHIVTSIEGHKWYQRLLAENGVDGHWPWPGAGPTQTVTGGFRSEGSGKKISVRRYVYEERVGPIPAGCTVNATCAVPRCVNPRHLTLEDPSAPVASLARTAGTVEFPRAWVDRMMRETRRYRLGVMNGMTKPEALREANKEFLERGMGLGEREWNRGKKVMDEFLSRGIISTVGPITMSVDEFAAACGWTVAPEIPSPVSDVRERGVRQRKAQH